MKNTQGVVDPPLGYHQNLSSPTVAVVVVVVVVVVTVAVL